MKHIIKQGIKKNAPIALFTYKRLEHTKKTIAALIKNKHAAESLLYVFSDGAKNDSDRAQVMAVRQYLKTLQNKKYFKDIVLIESATNKGLAQSIIDGVTRVVTKHGKIIVLEDDMLTNQYFLDYMNQALDMYEKEKEVISIHGYIYPVNNLPDYFFLKGADCWGWATWARGWALFEKDGKKLARALSQKNLIKEFNFNNAYPYYDMLQKQIAGTNNSWAIRWYASAFLKNKLTLYPGVSLVQNIGFGEGATHTGSKDTPYQRDDFNTTAQPAPLKKITIGEKTSAKQKIIKFFLNHKAQPLATIMARIKRIIKAVLKKILPTPLKVFLIKLWALVRRFKSPLYGWFGPYPSFAAVKKLSSGYDQENILAKVKDALLQVKNGTAVHERDSVLFDKIEYSWPAATALMYVAAQNKGKLSVLDFGGSLGSLYYQHRKFLSGIDVQWSVVEQPHFVNCGKEFFQDDKLTFFHKVKEAIQKNKPQVILFSSSWQYLETPYDFFKKEILPLRLPYVIFDLTGFQKIYNHDIVTWQKVPPQIYDASYPAWFFNEKKFKNFIKQHGYAIIEEWDHPHNIVINNKNNIPACYKGFLIKKV